MKVRETQQALLALFGLQDQTDIAHVQLELSGDIIPRLTVERFIDLDNTPGIKTKFQRFNVTLAGIDEWDAYQDHPAFDLDAECKAATQRVLDHIEDRYTVHSRVIARDFGAARDHMRSRHAHLKALQARSYIAQALADIVNATRQAHA